MNPWGAIDRLIRVRRALGRSILYAVLVLASVAVLVLTGWAYFATK